MTNLPARQIDVWLKATDHDKTAALASLAALPSRQTSSETLDRASYFVALEGVTRFGLAEAVRKIMQNALGHPFFPAPPELRGQCDKAMKPHEEYRDRMARRRKLAEEHAAHSIPARTPEEIAKVKRLLADFHAGYEKQADAFTATLDPELVAQVPDNPKARERMGMEAK